MEGDLAPPACSDLSLPSECVPLHGQPHSCRAISDLAATVEQLQTAQQTIDAVLVRPALWQGTLRREIHDYASTGDNRRYAAAYDRMAQSSVVNSDLCPTSELLRLVHDEAVGGRTFRKTELRVAGGYRFPDADSVSTLTEELFAQYRATDNSVVQAASLHLDLLTVHPFEDGNGRTARLLSSRELMRLGHRSMLTAAVEEHFHQFPKQYVRTLDMYRYGRICKLSCLTVLLRAALKSCCAAAWFGDRELLVWEVARDCLPLDSMSLPFGGLLELTLRGTKIGRVLEQELNRRGVVPLEGLMRQMNPENERNVIRQIRRWQSERCHEHREISSCREEGATRSRPDARTRCFSSESGDGKEARVPSLPQRRFRCLLDDQPTFLVPPSLADSGPARPGPGDLIVNPDCWFSWDGSPPPAVKACAQLLDGFHLDGDAVWIIDREARTTSPYLIGPSLLPHLHGVRPGSRAPSDLPAQTIDALAAARVLVYAEAETLRVDRWKDSLSFCRRLLRGGYAPLASPIHPFHIGELRRYYRHLIRSGAVRFGDKQCARRYSVHNETVARFFHHQLTHTVGEIVGEPVKPSYVFLASYQSGAVLPKHTDRAQCEFTISLLVDYSPEPPIETSWPLWLVTPTEGATAIYQAIGDALLYRGRALPHYREMLPQGCSSTSLFLHYVPRDFRGSLE